MSPLFGPNADKLLASGTLAPGTITGIDVRFSHDDPPVRVDEYAVQSGGTTYGIRQTLEPEGDVRLGMPVSLRIDGKAAIIEWGDVYTHRWKSLSAAPADGISDDTAGLGAARKKWTPATVSIESIDSRSVMFGMASVFDATVNVAIAGQEPYQTTIPKVYPSHYATHLFTAGSVLPGWVNPSRLDKVLIDWAAAAVATPGVGVASALPARGDTDVSVAIGDAAAEAVSKVAAKLPGAPSVDDEVSWETFIAAFKATNNGSVRGAEGDALAASVGVPAGEWDAVQARWMGRIARDMKLGIAFGQALSA